MTMTTQVITWVSTWLCFAASERMRPALSTDVAPMRLVIRWLIHLTKRASRIAPLMNSTISRPLLRSQSVMSLMGATSKAIASHRRTDAATPGRALLRWRHGRSAMLTTTAADGTDVRAFDEGRGPVILVLPGGMDDGRTWRKVAAALGARFRVLRLHRRRYRLDIPTRTPPTIAEEV